MPALNENPILFLRGFGAHLQLFVFFCGLAAQLEDDLIKRSSEWERQPAVGIKDHNLGCAR